MIGQAPIAKKIESKISFHGQEIIDEYNWLRDPNWPVVTQPEILEHLNAENAYAEDFFKPLQPEIDAIFDELKGRIKLDDISVPIKKKEYFYYVKTLADAQYPIYCRKHHRLDAEEEVLLDVNALAIDKKFTMVSNFVASPDNKLAVYTVDFEGNERGTARIFDLTTGEYLQEEIADVESVIWHEEGLGFFYNKFNENWRTDKVYFHKLGADPSNDKLIYHEQDSLFKVGIARSSSKKYVFIISQGHDSDETYYINMQHSDYQPILIMSKRESIRYSVDHCGEYFYIHTNDLGPNFRLARAKVVNPSEWEEYFAHDNKKYLSSFDLTANYLILNYRKDGLEKPEIMSFQDNQRKLVEFRDEAYEASAYSTNFEEDDIRINYSSLATPSTTYSYNYSDASLTILKQQEIPSGFDHDQYEIKRLWVESEDVKVPLTIFYKKSLFKKEGNPVYLTGYGSYGLKLPLSFRNTAVSYADRGIIYAIAHIRGGDDLGYEWYTSAKFLTKKRTFEDFIRCAEYLIEHNYTNAGQIAISGGSAGGLLMGYVLNAKPELFGAAIAHVPFVDVLNTMLDETLPLTPGEFKEWGNPKEKEYGEYILSYSPYENIKKQAYPPIYATAGVSDPRVGYWEAAKWVARLRDKKSDNNLLILKTNMAAGHFSSSGRFDYLKETALDIVFVSHTIL